jgi:hypothetical protein
MARSALPIRGCQWFRAGAAPAVAVLLWLASEPAGARDENDRFQNAVNYVFTGTIEPKDEPEIVDRKSCVVLVPDTKFKRYARYHLSRFKMDVSRISKKYSGPQILYELEVEGDDVVLEFVNLDKTTVAYGFKTAHIPLPGSLDQAERALQIIFSEYCKADKPKSPF